MNNFISSLNQEMLEDYCAVNSQKNPISLTLNSLSASALSHVIEQYSLFSKNISTFLLKAFYEMSYSGWESLAVELMQNIKEELNEETCGNDPHRLPHYVLLRRGFKDVDYEIGRVKASLYHFQ